MSEWVKVKFADDLPRCPCCEDPLCEEHYEHYAYCSCVGPNMEGYEYKEEDGVMYARLIQS